MLKIKNKGVLLIIVISIVSLFAGSSFAYNKIEGIEEEYANLNDRQVQRVLNSKSFDELIEEVNLLHDTVEMSDLIYYADAIRNKINRISDKKLINEILKKENSVSAKVILLQLMCFDGRHKYIEEIKPLVFDKTEDFEIRRNVLFNVIDNNSDAEMLETLSRDVEDRLSLQSLKLLSDIDGNRAHLVAKDIINNYSGDMSYGLRGAIITEAEYISRTEDQKAIDGLMRVCDDLLQKQRIGDVEKDTVIFSLSSMLTEESISYIVQSSKIDREAKVYCIDQNSLVLKEMLDEDVSAEEVKIVIDAMNIYPIKDIAAPLKEVLEDKWDDITDKMTESEQRTLRECLTKCIDSTQLKGETIVDY